MDPRLSVALPVLPALAHAAVLRWEAAYHVEHSGGGWADVADMLRAFSVLVILFAVGLGVLAALVRIPDMDRAARWVLVATLVPQVGWLLMLGLIRFSDATDATSLGEPSTTIAIASLCTVILLVAASVAAVVTLRRPQSRSA